MLFIIRQCRTGWLLFFGSLFPTVCLSGPNSLEVTFEASLYTRTCKVDVSPSLIEYGSVLANNIMKNDAGQINTLNRNIVLTLTECTGSGNLGGSSVFVSGNTAIINGKTLFKDSGSSQGVGIKLVSNGATKTAGESVWTLSQTSQQNDKHTVVAALSCGECQDTNGIGTGDFQASMTFTVITN